MRAIVKNPRATTKRIATPYSCWRSKNAQTKATITSRDVTIPLTVAYKIALFKIMARRLRRGMSAFRLALETSSSPIAFNACDLSMMRFMRAINTEMKAATAPRRNEGAVTWAMTWDSCVTEGVSKAICIGRAHSSKVVVRGAGHRRQADSAASAISDASSTETVLNSFLSGLNSDNSSKFRSALRGHDARFQCLTRVSRVDRASDESPLVPRPGSDICNAAYS